MLNPMFSNEGLGADMRSACVLRVSEERGDASSIDAVWCMHDLHCGRVHKTPNGHCSQ